MNESYCGKNCVACLEGMQRRCPGCKWGPGQPGRSVCPLAQCCWQKGHESCRTCTFHNNCGLLGQRESFPPKQTAAPPPAPPINRTPLVSPPTVQQANILGKWLSWHFWLEIVLIVFGLLTTMIPIESVPVSVSAVLATLSITLSCLPYLGLVKVQRGYLLPGLFRLAGLPFDLLAIFWANNWRMAKWTGLIQVIYLILYILMGWSEYLQNEKATAGLDVGLSKRWKRLCWPLLPIAILLLLGALLWSIDPVAGAPLIGFTVVALGIVGILELVFLYQSINAITRYLTYMERQNHNMPSGI